MNKKIIGWAVFTGWLLVIGIGIIRAVYNESHEEDQEVIEKPVAEVQSGVISSRKDSSDNERSNHLTG